MSPSPSSPASGTLPQAGERHRLPVLTGDRVGLFAALDHPPFAERVRRHQAASPCQGSLEHARFGRVSERALIGRRALLPVPSSNTAASPMSADRGGVRRSPDHAGPLPRRLGGYVPRRRQVRQRIHRPEGSRAMAAGRARRLFTSPGAVRLVNHGSAAVMAGTAAAVATR